LPGLFDSLVRQKLSADAFEIIIVDNNSTDNTAELSRQFIRENTDHSIKYFFEEKPGLSNARNRGIQESDAPWLVFIDDDAKASSGYLEAIANYVGQNPETHAGGGKITPDYESSEPAWMSSYLLPVVSALDLGDSIRKFPARKYPIGANMFFSKKVFETQGLFNPELGRRGKYLLGGEEKDVFQRLGKSARIVYLPKAEVFHYVPDSRLKFKYVRDMAFGVGYSEKTRIRKYGKGLFLLYLKELFKWGASILLFFTYLAKNQYPKGKMLILFRYYVSKGMVTRNSQYA